MFQTPMNIHKHGMALKGQSGLCFVASALGSDWQCVKPFSSPGDYQRHNGVWDTESAEQGNFVKCWYKLDFFYLFPIIWNITQKNKVIQFYMLHATQVMHYSNVLFKVTD